jgi:hypothetical protein
LHFGDDPLKSSSRRCRTSTKGGDEVDAILVLFAVVDGLILIDLLALLVGSDSRRSIGDEFQRRDRG